MINNRADYRFVAGDINRVAIDGGIMPARPANAKKILRGEDLCFLAEAHEARANLWNNAVFRTSGATYNDDPTDITVISPGNQFNFTRVLSLAQLQNICNMHTTDSAKRPGSGGPQAIAPFFLKQLPQAMYAQYGSTILNQIINQLDGMIQDTPIQMPAANLNGRILLQNEVQTMFQDNSLFRLYGCGNTDLGYGYGVGTTNQTSYVRYGDTSVIGDFAKHCVFHNIVVSNTTTPNVLQEGCPDSTLIFAKFNDDGDVNNAEYWGVFLFEYTPPGSSTIQRWLWLGKICDFQLIANEWQAKQTAGEWRAWFRRLWYTVASVNLAASPADIPSGAYNYSALTYLYCPFAIVTPNNRFIW